MAIDIATESKKVAAIDTATEILYRLAVAATFVAATLKVWILVPRVGEDGNY